jgi:F-type H+-transporting ATPase subunit epsilon
VSSLQVELVAADRKVWEGEASQVSARSIEGDLGILPGHQPLRSTEGSSRWTTTG